MDIFRSSLRWPAFDIIHRCKVVDRSRAFEIVSRAICLAVITVSALEVLAIEGCHDLTQVTDPDIVQPQANNDSLGAVGRRAGALISFAIGFGNQVVGSGVISDELSSSTGGVGGDDQRIQSPSGGGYRYDLLSSARISSLRALASLKQWAPTPAWHVGELYALVGNIELFFSENMCSGVPLGNVVNGTPVYGNTVTRIQLLQSALSDFDSARANAGGSDSVINLAAVGQARALLDSGDFDDAAAKANAVPTAFQYTIGYASLSAGGQQQNPVYINSAFNYGSVFVSDREGGNGLDFVSAADARVPTAAINGLAVPLADSSASAPLTLASGVEAQLIVAEAALHDGDVNRWSGILNTLRTTAIVPSLDTLPSDSTTLASAGEQLAVMFRERAFWMFLTGHRQGDLRRLIRQYGLAAESVFPTGLYQGGPQKYGTAVVYQPFGEGLNPNFHGCFDQGA
jgi:hypothetical protein